MKKVGILFFILIGITTSCSENFFSSPKEFDLDEFENQVSVVGRLVNTDLDTLFDFSAVNNLGFLISRSKSVLNQQDFSIIENASVLLTGDDGTNIEYFYHDDSGNYYPANIGTPNFEILSIKENTTYELMVEIPGEDMITAVCKTESFGKIGAVDVVLDDIAGDQNYSLDRLQIEINDPNGKNFYFLKVIYFYDVVFEDGFELRDMRLGYIYNASSVLSGEADSFTDELFEGKNEILEFWSERYTGNSRNTLKSGNYEEPDAMVVGLWSLTEEEYNFRKSISNNRDAEDNPFAEPTIVFSNIENGLGIFSLMKLNEFEVEL